MKRKNCTLIEIFVSLGLVVIFAGCMLLAMDSCSDAEEHTARRNIKHAAQIHLLFNAWEKQTGNPRKLTTEEFEVLFIEEKYVAGDMKMVIRPGAFYENIKESK